MNNAIDVRQRNEPVCQDNNSGTYGKMKASVVTAVITAIVAHLTTINFISENKAKDAQASPLVSPNEALKIKMLFLLGETERLIQCTFPSGESRHKIVMELRNLRNRHDLSNQGHAEILLNAMEKLLEQRRKEMVALCENYSKMNSEEKDSQIIYQSYMNDLRVDIDAIDNTLRYIRGNMIRRMV